VDVLKKNLSFGVSEEMAEAVKAFRERMELSADADAARLLIHQALASNGLLDAQRPRRSFR
jgi:hypothetical protein